MNSILELAQEFHKRDNKYFIGVSIGVVKSLTPLKISICDGKIILEDKDTARVCVSLIEKERQASLEILGGEIKSNIGVKKEGIADIKNERAKITFKEILQVGDEVLCIPLEGEQEWIIVDKVV